MDFKTLEVGQCRKGYCGRKATETRCNRPKSTSAVVLQRVRCICKGGVESQRGVQSQRVRYKRKGFPAGAVKTQKTLNQINAKGRAETRPLTLNYLLLPLT